MYTILVDVATGDEEKRLALSGIYAVNRLLEELAGTRSDYGRNLDARARADVGERLNPKLVQRALVILKRVASYGWREVRDYRIFKHDPSQFVTIQSVRDAFSYDVAQPEAEVPYSRKMEAALIATQAGMRFLQIPITAWDMPFDQEHLKELIGDILNHVVTDQVVGTQGLMCGTIVPSHIYHLYLLLHTGNSSDSKAIIAQLNRMLLPFDYRIRSHVLLYLAACCVTNCPHRVLRSNITIDAMKSLDRFMAYAKAENCCMNDGMVNMSLLSTVKLFQIGHSHGSQILKLYGFDPTKGGVEPHEPYDRWIKLEDKSQKEWTDVFSNEILHLINMLKERRRKARPAITGVTPDPNQTATSDTIITVPIRRDDVIASALTSSSDPPQHSAKASYGPDTLDFIHFVTQREVIDLSNKAFDAINEAITQRPSIYMDLVPQSRTERIHKVRVAQDGMGVLPGKFGKARNLPTSSVVDESEL